MGKEMDPLLETRSIVLHNESIFLETQGDLCRAYRTIHHNFEKLIRVCGESRDKENRSLVTFVSFLLFMQRQGLAAFWKLAAFQSYDAWVLLRPVLEAPLIMGKWIDDFSNFEIWRDRDKDRGAYLRAYQGRKIESRSLPRSREIREVLSRLNDNFPHFNREYFERHTEYRRESEEMGSISVHVFDRSDAETRASGLAMLHLVVVIQDSIEQLWKELYGQLGEVGIDLAGFEDLFRERVETFVRENPEQRAVLEEIGLWSLQPKVC